MAGFIGVENVMLGRHAASRDEVLRDLADKACELGVTSNSDAVYRSFLQREDMGPTGMMEGFAIPHAKSSAITAATIIVYKNGSKLDWPSFDEQPVDICVALLVPDGEAGTTHIKLLSKTAVLLMDDDFKSLLRDADDAEAIVRAINERLEEV
ncbi:PTS sugar transporter subunit IIA [Olsenella sp. HMSC062G07]|uniref:PTS sugar transporter subunit IIA n=1 Tax=Olsenella sp. HMSC062G07 TaxID=1739330 RepID=UPI0008A13D30|nr:fructose PTS transporter subunit IIA [Olsenella sp. HMSC062G07]OFK23253.1 PTS fructose transporter subunit IIA [Olsenella sp. HMSC062G07]